MSVSKQPRKTRRDLKVALLGNPNVGKSVIFGFLTGRRATVSNYPGTTIEVSRGTFHHDKDKATLIDTPGVNSLVPMSEDEEVTRNLLLHEKMDAILQISDAKNLRRALLVSLQLSEMGLPFLLDLNMEDELAALGMKIDKEQLSALLGVPVVGTIAIQRKGLKDLQKRLSDITPSSYRFSYSEPIETACQKIASLLPASHLSQRSIALMILSSDKSLIPWLHERLPQETMDKIDGIRSQLARKYSEPMAYLINKQRMKAVDDLVDLVLKSEVRKKRGVLDRLGVYSMHSFWGIFILIAVLFLFYEFVGNFGAQIAVDWFENTLFGNYINPWATKIFAKVFFFSPFMRDLFVGEYGIITVALTYAMAIIFPIVTTFFIAFSIIEDSGYLPRLAIMLNRIFKWMGLNGKAVVPMVLGLGCDTMATMSARIMDTKKERIILTLLLALGIPCSAQLGIILAMLSVLPSWATVLWFAVVIGVILLVGYLSSKILSGGRSDFLMEIPPLRRPTLFNIMTKTVARLEWYLKEVVPLFILATLILFFLDKVHALTWIENMASPVVVRFLDLPPQAAEAFIVGFLRRDYGATHFFDLYHQGRLDAVQAIVSLIIMTLFVPCLANLMMIIKERGIVAALAIVGFIYPFAILIGGIVNWGLRWNF